MLIYSLLFLLLSNSITLRRDKSLLFSRVVLVILFLSFFFALDNLFLDSVARGLGLFGGLFHTTSTTQIFHIFIFFISAIILQLTAFYPRRV
jgi:NADH-ubiquinone oxidoreductase chain 2